MRAHRPMPREATRERTQVVDVMQYTLLVAAQYRATPMAVAFERMFDRVSWCVVPHEMSRHIEADRPHTILVDTDLGDGVERAACLAARQLAQPARVLLVTGEVARVPGALKHGCSSVLLKPFPANLLIARLSRLRHQRAVHEMGTNVAWPGVRCGRCQASHAISFDAAAYRRCWFACLSCDHVWLGADPERSPSARMGAGRHDPVFDIVG